jgi:hypothetical protein
MDDLVLVRSDRGDGGWSLYRPFATEEEIREGDTPPLLSGGATWVDGAWNRPDVDDYTAAREALDALP